MVEWQHHLPAVAKHFHYLCESCLRWPAPSTWWPGTWLPSMWWPGMWWLGEVLGLETTSQRRAQHQFASDGSGIAAHWLPGHQAALVGARDWAPGIGSRAPLAVGRNTARCTAGGPGSPSDTGLVGCSGCWLLPGCPLQVSLIQHQRRASSRRTAWKTAWQTALPCLPCSLPPPKENPARG